MDLGRAEPLPAQRCGGRGEAGSETGRARALDGWTLGVSLTLTMPVVGDKKGQSPPTVKTEGDAKPRMR